MRMARYDVRNDGAGPYAIFHCNKCYREFRTPPNIGNTVANSVGRAALGGLLRNIPLVGYEVADNVQDVRYATQMSPQQIDAAWSGVAEQFHECPVCRMMVCPSDWDAQTGHCNEDSPRRAQIAQAQAEQAAGMAQGFAAAFGLGGALTNLGAAAQAAAATLPRCAQCGTPAARGAKFCATCGGAVVVPQALAAPSACPSCGRPAPAGAAFCMHCGGKIVAATAAPPATCPNCGTAVQGRFCGGCGAPVS